MKGWVIVILLFWGVGIAGSAALAPAKAPREPPPRKWGAVWSIAPTVVALIEGAAEVEMEAQNALTSRLVLSTLCDLAVVPSAPPSVLLELGLGYNPMATGLAGPLIGLYPGCFIPFSRELPVVVSLSGRVQQQWMAPFGLLLSAGLGATYFFGPIDLFKWDLSLGVGFAVP